MWFLVRVRTKEGERVVPMFVPSSIIERARREAELDRLRYDAEQRRKEG